MRSLSHLSSSASRRSWAALLVLAAMFAGMLPAFHHHEESGFENACHDESHPVSHLTGVVVVEHHEPCGLCAKISSPAGLGEQLAVAAGQLDGARLHELSELLPNGPSGRYGASRAPPAA